jgi:iron complex outermembrane receptor protein
MLALSLSVDAHAQAVPSTSPDASSGLEDIVVTARRVREDVSKVPITVTALSASAIAEQGITTETDLQAAVPGLTVRASETNNQLNFSIRGQSLDSFSGGAPGVLPYIDEVQINTATASSLYDMENIQVLEGPQGTLFGRNDTGGAVLFATAKPSNEFTGYMKYDIGSYDLQHFTGAVDIPILDNKLIARIAVDRNSQAGYVTNVYDNSTLGSTDDTSVRATILFRPAEQLENQTVLQYSENGGISVAGSAYSITPCGSGGTIPGVIIPASCIYTASVDAGLHATTPQVPAAALANYLQYQKNVLGFYKVDLNTTPDHNSHGFFAVNTTTDDVTPDLQIKNIFGASNSKSTDAIDFTGVPYQIYDAPNPGNISTFSQYSDELHASGKALDNHLTYIFGPYFSYEKDGNVIPNCIECDLQSPPGSDVFYYRWQTVDRSEAIYAQGSYAFGDSGLSLTLGGRETWEEIGVQHLPGDTLLLSGLPASEHETFIKPSWTVGLDYQVRPDLLLYVAQRGSWLTGGFNAEAATPNESFKPETTKDVEVGAKFNGRLFGVPARVNVAFYNQWVYNAQRAVYLAKGLTTESITDNVPEAEVTGFELSGDISAASWLILGFNTAYNDARYTNGTVAVPGFTPLFFGPYGVTPKLTVSGSTKFILPVPSAWGDMSFRVDEY